VAAVIPPTSLVNLLQQALGTDDTITLHLFSDTITPSPTIGLGQLTECAFSGYAPIVLTPAVAPVEDEDGVVGTQEMSASFEYGSGSTSGTVQGWYLTQDSSSTTKLVTYEVDDDAPITMASLGDAYDVTVTILAMQE
jgi:hypothetical protein